MEKKQTGVIASRLMKKMVSNESTKPRLKTGTARAPMANDETTMFAESHCLDISTSTQTRPLERPIRGEQCVHTMVPI